MESIFSLVHELIQNNPWETFFLVYFLPTIISFCNPRSKKSKIFFLNLAGGWTVVYWIVVFLLAFTNTKNPTQKTKQVRDLELQSVSQIRTKAEHFQIIGSRQSRHTGSRPKGFVMTQYVEPAVKWWRHLP